MKSLLLASVFLGGFFVASLQVVMNQVNALAQFYSNLDKYAQSTADPKNQKMEPPTELQTVISPLYADSR